MDTNDLVVLLIVLGVGAFFVWACRGLVSKTEEYSQQPKRDPNRKLAPPPRGGSGVPKL